MDTVITALTKILLAAKVTGVSVELSTDRRQPLHISCSDYQSQVAFLKLLFGGHAGQLTEEFQVLKDANAERLTRAINRLIVTGSIWSDQAFEYGC